MMDVQPDDPKTLLSGALTVLALVFAWVWNRLVRQQDRHDQRLNALESTVATKGDITAVYERVNALADQSREQYADLSNRMNEQHAAILQTIIEKRR